MEAGEDVVDELRAVVAGDEVTEAWEMIEAEAEAEVEEETAEEVEAEEDREFGEVKAERDRRRGFRLGPFKSC